jgi:peroxiredoxin/uncharacterized GH25 family protein
LNEIHQLVVKCSVAQSTVFSKGAIMSRRLEFSRVVSVCGAVSLLVLGAVNTLHAATTTSARPDLTGVITGENGDGLSGATVFIYTAGPKEGIGILCPSCYADCRKWATTDKTGHFKIESLDPSLLFRILVVAKKHQPEFTNKVDPAAKSLEITLLSAREGIKPDHQMKGRVIDTQGKPIPGAVVNIRGVSRAESTQFGGNNDLDQVAVSDENGEFVINSETSFDAVGIDIEAGGYAKGVFQHLASGGKIHELKLTEGASVRGRLVKDGKPIAGVEMGISGAERNAENYVGDFSVGTDNEGKFLLVNLPPNHSYFVYAHMSSLGTKGAVPARRVQVNEDGSMFDVGDISVVEGFKLEGKLRLSDGELLPFGTRVLLSRDEAWDSIQTEADDDGLFHFVGVPPDTISLSARVRGYHLSGHNRSLESNGFSLAGVLKSDKTDLVIEFDPGEHRPQPTEYVDIRQEPLMGAEAVKGQKGDIHVTGTVIDAETKRPVGSFTITEGRIAPFPETTQWLENRQTQGTNGQLDLFLNRSRGAAPFIAPGSKAGPVIMVEAEGYDPQSSGPIMGSETNFTFALKKGGGIAGVLLKPNGEPAPDVKVYLADMRNGVYVQDKDMHVQERIYQGTRSTTTDEHGKFAFKRRVDDYAILVLDDDGFAQVLVDQLGTNAEVRLQPWAKVQGKLLIGSRPGTNEAIKLGLAFLPYESLPRNFPPLGLYLDTKTDAEGNFSFDRVPPLNVQVYHSPKVKDRNLGMFPTSQTTSFTLKPGEEKTLTLGGHGRPVIGRAVVNDYEGNIDWRADVQSMDLILPPTEAFPDQLAQSRAQSAKLQAAESEDERKQIMEDMRKAHEENVAKQRAFYATEKGREYYFSNKRYALNFAQDGSFRVEDVPAGKYKLRIDLREPGDGPMSFNAPQIAYVEKEFEVPDSPGGRTDEPFDLGKIEMQSRRPLKIGKNAPAFEAKTVDGKTVRLSDFSGKYLLFDFWAVWCGPCVAETPHLKAAYEAFKNNPRFAMLGLSLDPDAKAPREYASKNQLGWTMGFLGDWSKTELPAKYGVNGIPCIFLIGPDGKILARDLRGDSIRSTVANNLPKIESAKAP